MLNITSPHAYLVLIILRVDGNIYEVILGEADTSFESYWLPAVQPLVEHICVAVAICKVCMLNNCYKFKISSLLQLPMVK
jgi:hypothetical protein